MLTRGWITPADRCIQITRHEALPLLSEQALRNKDIGTQLDKALVTLTEHVSVFLSLNINAQTI